MLRDILTRLWLGLIALLIGWVFRQGGAPYWAAGLAGLVTLGFEFTFWSLHDLAKVLLEIQQKRGYGAVAPFDDN
jgi:hypothetical protein